MKESAVLALLNQDVDSIPLHAAWEDVAAEFGVDLPREYKVLVDSGDPIELFSFVFLINPFAPDGSFPIQNNPMIDFIRKGIQNYERDAAKVLNKVFPIGYIENGSELWLVREEHGWSVDVADMHWMSLESFDMRLTEFLQKFICGEIRPQQFPEEILRRQGWPLQ